MRRFLVVIEKSKKNFSAYSPDLPGCAATGRTAAEAEKNMHAAIAFHIEGLIEDKQPIPKPHAIAEYMAVG